MKINLIVSDSYFFIKESIEKIYGDFSDVIKIDFLDSAIDDVLIEASTVSLFGEGKKIVVENADDIFTKDFDGEELLKYFKNPNEDVVLSFVVTKFDKTSPLYKYILENYKVYDGSLKKSKDYVVDVKNYVTKKGSHISDVALNYIKDACLGNYDLMISEINKLLILGKDNISDELVYNLVKLTPDGNTNRLIDALLDANSKDAFTCVKNMEILNIDLTKLIALIAWNVRLMYLFKINRKDQSKINEIMKLYNVKDFTYNKIIRRANTYSVKDLEVILIKLADIEIGIKEFRITKEQVGYYLIDLFCI